MHPVIFYPIVAISAVFISSIILNIIKHLRISLKYKNIGLISIKTLIIFWAFYLFATTIARYLNLISESIDVSYYHIAIRQLAEFKIPRIWDVPFRFIWGDHFEPILLLFVPFYWLKKDATIIMAIQSLVVISGFIPLYLLTKKKFASQLLALATGVSYLLFGGLQFGYVYGFHPIVLFPTIFFGLIIY